MFQKNTSASNKNGNAEKTKPSKLPMVEKQKVGDTPIKKEDRTIGNQEQKSKTATNK